MIWQILTEFQKKRQVDHFVQKRLKMTFLPKIYPSGISRAIASIDELPVFKELPDGFFRIVVRIIKKINLRSPSNPVFASRSTLAEESGKSIETVHRAIRWLEEHGFIERAQKARSGLRGSTSPLTPTSKFLDALLLTPETALQIRSAKHVAPDAPTPQPSREFVRVNGFTLPTDLAWLAQDGGVTAPAVLMLMRMAKQANQKLSNVVSATKQYLKPLKGRALFSYLRKLVLKGQDFTWKADTQKQQHMENQLQDHLARKAQDMVGRQFQNSDGTLVVEVDATGMLRETKNGNSVMRFFTENFLDALAARRLIPIKPCL